MIDPGIIMKLGIIVGWQSRAAKHSELVSQIDIWQAQYRARAAAGMHRMAGGIGRSAGLAASPGPATLRHKSPLCTTTPNFSNRGSPSGGNLPGSSP